MFVNCVDCSKTLKTLYKHVRVTLARSLIHCSSECVLCSVHDSSPMLFHHC